MKRITAITFSVLAVLTTVRGAMAQAGVVRATIPFDFTVVNRSFAGWDLRDHAVTATA
jgi:hypothetical protein